MPKLQKDPGRGSAAGGTKVGVGQIRCSEGTSLRMVVLLFMGW